MRLLNISFCAIIFVIIISCCHSKQQTGKLPAAKDVLTDRNTRDPRIDSLQKPVEKALPNIKAKH